MYKLRVRHILTSNLELPARLVYLRALQHIACGDGYHDAAPAIADKLDTITVPIPTFHHFTSHLVSNTTRRSTERRTMRWYLLLGTSTSVAPRRFRHGTQLCGARLLHMFPSLFAWGARLSTDTHATANWSALGIYPSSLMIPSFLCLAYRHWRSGYRVASQYGCIWDRIVCESLSQHINSNCILQSRVFCRYLLVMMFKTRSHVKWAQLPHHRESQHLPLPSSNCTLSPSSSLDITLSLYFNISACPYLACQKKSACKSGRLPTSPSHLVSSLCAHSHTTKTTMSSGSVRATHQALRPPSSTFATKRVRKLITRLEKLVILFDITLDRCPRLPTSLRSIPTDTTSASIRIYSICH